MNILAHTSFIGTTGYNNHARSFFTALNKYHTVKVRNYTIGSGWKGFNNTTPHDDESYITDEIKGMLYQQTLYNSDKKRNDEPIYGYDKNFKPDVHIVLNDVNHPYFYDDYDGYKIAFNVWESTRYPDNFFKRLFYFDEVWVPSQWQMDCLVEQGYPKEKISVVPEGVDVETFKPLKDIPKKDKFRFLLFGRWEWRKSTTEIIRTFGEAFKGRNDVELICSVENPYPSDGLTSTKDRMINNHLFYDNVTYVNFPSREEYIKYLQEGDVFVSCARSEGWNLPAIEAMACGTPTMYSNWGGQLQFTQNKGIPVKIHGLVDANKEHKDFPGQYCEPDFEDLDYQMRSVYEEYKNNKILAQWDSVEIHKSFNWDKIAKDASVLLENTPSIRPSVTPSFAFVTTGNIGYMPVIEMLVKSLWEFSDQNIIVYGVDCDVPFDYPNLIKKRINPPIKSEHDKWYWKQYACIESLNEDYDNFVWIDGDVIVNHDIDNIQKYFSQIENYPLSDVHRQVEFFGTYNHNGDDCSQLFNENVAKHYNINKNTPLAHICMYVYNRNCKWWFDEIIGIYNETDLKDYKKLLLWNDEGIDNLLRWKYNFTKYLPLSNFDTSSYDGDLGQTNNQLNDFYKFWNEDGPQNFDRIFGYQFIPKDKNDILYFHGNKDSNVSSAMIDFIKMKKENSIYKSDYFYTSVYKLENFGEIRGIHGGTMDIANKYGWQKAIYHEIYNLEDYYNNHVKIINKGDVVVDLGGNMGIFNRWAYSQGASKVISFEPDKRYFKLLQLNTDPSSILFNAAVSKSMGEMELYESEHYGGSTLIGSGGYHYPVRTYTLNYLFETGLIDKIDFLKIDIEGAEHYALQGISDENLSKVKNISMEYHHSHMDFNEQLREQFIKRLNNLGFNSYLLFMGTNNALQMIYFTK